MQYSPAFAPGAATYEPATGFCLDQPAPAKCSRPILKVDAPYYCEEIADAKAFFAQEARAKAAREAGATRRRALQGKDPAVMGAWSLIRDRNGRSSTGAVAMHAVLIPR